MRYMLLTTTVLIATALPAAADWAPDQDYIIGLQMKFFEDKSPEQIARFLSHHNGQPYSAAVRSLAAKGDEALPLLKKLLADKHPWIRGGAVEVLGVMYKFEGKTRGKDAETPVLTPEIKGVIAMVSKLAEDDHPAVQAALGSFMANVHIETPESRKIALWMASNGDAAVRGRAIKMASWLKDPKTVVGIGQRVIENGGNNVPRMWGRSISLLLKHPELARPALPGVLKFANNRAHRTRGMFSDGPHKSGLALMDKLINADLRKDPAFVRALVQLYDRMPYSKYPGWVAAREQAKALLEKLDHTSVPALRAAIASEKKWIETGPEEEVRFAVESSRADVEVIRARCRTSIKYFEELATKLEAAGKKK